MPAVTPARRHAIVGRAGVGSAAVAQLEREEQQHLPDGEGSAEGAQGGLHDANDMGESPGVQSAGSALQVTRLPGTPPLEPGGGLDQQVVRLAEDEADQVSSELGATEKG